MLQKTEYILQWFMTTRSSCFFLNVKYVITIKSLYLRLIFIGDKYNFRTKPKSEKKSYYEERACLPDM